MPALTFPSAMRLLGQKNYQAVYDLAISALRQNEKDPLAFFFLGIIASDHGDPVKALELFAKASEHGPKSARYNAYHAKALMTLGHHAEAKVRAGVAANLKIDDAFVADMIGNVYSRVGEHNLALPLFKKAVKLNPNWAVFQFNLGASAQFVGDIRAAKQAYERALAIDPKFYRVWFALVSLETQTKDTHYLERLKSLFHAAGQDADAQSLLGHAIAKTLEDLGQHPESFDWLEKAKTLQRRKISYSPDETAKIFNSAKLTAKPPVSKPIASQDKTPVFIVGLPRTGTTLFDRILSSHKDVMSAGEIDLFSAIVRQVIGEAHPYSPSLFDKTNALDLRDIGNIYRKKIRELSGDASYLIDKTPLNFFYAGLIHRALPEAKIITIRRGAMDSCLSNYRQLFALGDSRYHYALDIEYMADYYHQFDALMRHWKKRLPEQSYTETHYEKLVQNQEVETRRLLAFCGLDWDEACLRFHENAAPTDTASSVQVRQPLYAGAIGRWKKYGPKLDGLKTALGDLAEI